MQQEETNDLLNALVHLNDKSPLQFEPSERTGYVDPLRYKSFELLEYLSEIKLGLEVIKENSKGRVDKIIKEQFTRIDKAISSITDKLLESGSSD
ncbi:MAG TPA: hypothetical protein VLA53_03560 [Nitrosopumilaceae archaeon]|nr:hypothetical protein [Nitrosopumilaceae archaeon]